MDREEWGQGLVHGGDMGEKSDEDSDKNRGGDRAEGKGGDRDRLGWDRVQYTV